MKCSECDQPMLKKGQERQHPDDYRHARGCPKASDAERAQTEAMWGDTEDDEERLLLLLRESGLGES